MNIRSKMSRICSYCKRIKGSSKDVVVKEIYNDELLPHDRYSSGCGCKTETKEDKCPKCHSYVKEYTKIYYILSDEEWRETQGYYYDDEYWDDEWDNEEI